MLLILVLLVVIIVVLITKIVLELVHGITASSGGAGPSGIDANGSAAHFAAFCGKHIFSHLHILASFHAHNEVSVKTARQGNKKQFDKNHIVLECSTENQALTIDS